MNNLCVPVDLSFAYYEAIVMAKQEPRSGRLASLSSIIQASYEDYSTSSTMLSRLVAKQFTTIQIEDLHHCYLVKTAPLEKMKRDINDHHRTNCPGSAALCQYCGLSYNVKGFDHYLPKNVFPEFSTLNLNLVPCCGTCNNLKDEKWLDDSGARMVVSFYFDLLPETQFLSASIEDGRIPMAQFYLSDDSVNYGELESVMRNHFATLQLLDRFKLAAPAELSELQVECAAIGRRHGISRFKEILKLRETSFAQIHSPNYWKVPLYQALAESEELLLNWVGDAS